MKKNLAFLSLFVMLVLVAAPAQAGTIWTGSITSDHSTGGLGTPPFGTVVLTQDGLDVDFVITLSSGYQFVRTGAGSDMDFLFNFGGSDYTPSNLPPALSIEGTGVTLANAPIKNGNIDWFVGGGKGDFYYGVYFTNQGKGGSDPYDGPLQFTVKNATIDDLIQTNDIGEIFLADVLSPTGATGLADVSSGEKHQVPEPGSLVLLGLGIAGLAGFKRFKD